MKQDLQPNSGVTLLEIMIVIIMIAILSVIAIPDFQEFLRKNRTTAQAGEFVGAVNYTRSEAVKRGQRVSICKSPDGVQCVTSGNWDQGWLVFVDLNENGQVDTGETVLQVREGLSGGNTMAGLSPIEYVATGFVEQNATVSLCNGSSGVDILVARTGRVRTEKVSCP